MIRVVAVAVAVFAAFYAIGAVVIFSTGCTEPGDCSPAGELARDHGFAIAVAGSLAVLAGGIAARALRKGSR